jgi:DNA-binding transcriptional LysR family regulator
MDIKQLSYFVETCKYMSFSDAAKALFLTPQALSKSIRNLELELGGAVFSRTGNAIALTEYGTLLLQRAKNLLKSYDVLIGDMKYATHRVSGKLAAGFAYGVLKSLPPDAVMNFMRAYPELSLELEELPEEMLEERMLEGSLDFAFSVGPPMRPALFESIPVCASPMSAVLLKENPLYRKGFFTLEDLRDQKFILHTHNKKVNEMIDKACRERGFTPEYLICSSYLELNKRVLWSMGGLSLGPYNLWRSYSYTPEVGCIPMADEAVLSWEIYLVTPADRQRTPAAQLLAEHLSKELTRLVQGAE